MIDDPKIPDYIYNRKFNSKQKRDSFAKRFYPNRVVSIDQYIDFKTELTVYRVKYYRDTKRMRFRQNFPETNHYQDYPELFWKD